MALSPKSKRLQKERAYTAAGCDLKDAHHYICPVSIAIERSAGRLDVPDESSLFFSNKDDRVGQLVSFTKWLR